MALRPYSVPCGPGSTSNRAMSKNAALVASRGGGYHVLDTWGIAGRSGAT